METVIRMPIFDKYDNAITTWDFKDGAWLNAPSGYVRKDNTLKPSYKMLRKLIREEWWTDMKVKTDSEGNAVVEAFMGDYSLEADGMSCKASLTDNEPLNVSLS